MVMIMKTSKMITNHYRIDNYDDDIDTDDITTIIILMVITRIQGN